MPNQTLRGQRGQVVRISDAASTAGTALIGDGAADDGNPHMGDRNLNYYI